MDNVELGFFNAFRFKWFGLKSKYSFFCVKSVETAGLNTRKLIK